MNKQAFSMVGVWVIVLVLALAMPAAPAQAGGVVSVCDESHLTAALAGGGAVTFTCSGTITLASTITIAENTTIDGSGQTVTLSGGNLVRVFKVNDGITLNLNDLTITGGRAPDGGGSGGAISGGSGSTLIISNTTFLGNTAPTGGGAIYFPGGSLTITDSIFSGNTARLGGAVYAGGGALSVTGSSFSDNGTASTDGGAIHSSGSTLTVSSSSFDGNSGSEGGAILIQRGTATVMDSTFFNNSAVVAGGALDIFPGSVVGVDASTIHENRASSAGGGIFNQASLTLTNSTLWKNLGTTEGGGIANAGGGTATVLNSTIANNGGGSGGGVYNSSGTVTLKNTIVANSSSGGNCSGAITDGTIVDGGGNLSYPDATCPGIQGDPVLGSLQDLGGLTQTMPIQPGSAAIDAGSDAACAAEDQRGLARPQGPGCDIGAYEVGHFAVTKATDDNGECRAGDCALREAILAANARPGHDWIDVPAATYQLTMGTPVPQDEGDLKIRDALTIAGASASSTIIHQTVADGVFDIEDVSAGTPSVLLRNLTIENGASALDGGGILNRGVLTLERCTVKGNTAEHGGGGIASWTTLTVNDSTISDNRAEEMGGGVYNPGWMAVSGSTFSGNGPSDGGGIFNEGALYVVTSTFSDNRAPNTGGGINSTDTLEVINSTFSGNSAGDRGGAIYAQWEVYLAFATLSGNSAATGGGIYQERVFGGLLQIYESIVANSLSGENCVGYSAPAGWSNVIDYPDGSCKGSNVDPRLGPLQDNGGPTWTMALQPGSPAIDTAKDGWCDEASVAGRDQRGAPRPTGAACDIGAYEARAFDTYTQFDGGQAFTCARRTDGVVNCWGSNTDGQATAPSGDFTQVSAGGRHACAIRAADGKVTCWGSNSIPVKSCVSETCDTVYLDAGQARPPDGAFVSVTAGAYHTCGLKSDGSVDCWGSNINENQKSIGQAQDRTGPFTQVSAGMWHNCAVRNADGTVECWGDTADGKATPPAGIAFTQVTAGANHTCGLKPDGSVACWGGNTWGQAPKTRTGPYKEIQAGDLFTCGLLRNGTLDCWGYNFYGQTKEPAGVLTAFGLGDAHGCATLDSNDEWICWGRNDHGQAPDNPALPPQTSEPEDQPPVVQIFLDPAEPDGANDWYRSPVTVEPQASDDTEVAGLRCALDPARPPAAYDDLPEEPCPFLGGAEVSAEGRHTFYAAAADVWGNQSAPVSASFKIDMPPPGLTSLEMVVNRGQAYAGAILQYTFKVRNLTPSAQAFAVIDPIPANTEIVRRINYNASTNSVEWSGVVEPYGFKTSTVYVRINPGTPGGTAIVNTATLVDEPGGGSASATTIVKMLPPPRGHRADIDVNEVVIRGN